MKAPQLSIFNYSITNQADDTVEIHVDGDIVDASTKELMQAYWGDETSTSFKSFREQIPANVRTVNLYVNSGGGHVGDAMAIHDYLKELENKGVTVNRKGRGIVASAATYLIMGNNSEMSENSWFMIHNASGWAYGDVNQVENQARTLRKFNDRITSFYAENTGLSETVIANYMNKETWFTAKEAKDKGFVKNVSGEAKFTNSIKPEQWQFNNNAVLNAYNSFTKQNDVHMDTSKITEAISNGFNGLLEKLNLTNKKDDAAVQNAFKEFSEGITNGLKDVPDSVSITNQVNEAVTNALKEIGKNESFTNAITEAVKDLATTESVSTTVKNEVKEGLKDVLTKTEFTNQFATATATLTKAITDKMGNKSGEGIDNKGKKLPNNKFAKANLEE